MRPDFKDRSSSNNKNRRKPSASIRNRSRSFSPLNELAESFWQNQWHIVTAALLVLTLVMLSLWALQQKAKPSTQIRVAIPDKPVTDTGNHVELSRELSNIQHAIRRHKWISEPLALPASEEEKFQQVLKSHKLVQRTTALETKSITNNTVAEKKSGNWQTWKVRNGDNLATMAKRYGVKASDIHYLMQSGKAAKELKRIYPKQSIHVQTTDTGEILELHYDITATKRLTITRQGTDKQTNTAKLFQTEIIERPYDVQTAFAQGIIQDSLFLAGTKAGISDRLTMELAGIFGWDIDFVQDIRTGDRFSLLFEERYRDGERVKGNKSEGAILAAEFINNGRKIRAIRYTLADGRTDYFTPEGKSLRKAFIRNPVDFARISSKFNLKRKHPILNKIRAHKGVDYAAPTGTPIRTAGDGKVVFRGKKGGYGNVIIVQHGQRYSTLYAHMSKYARGSNRGKRVRQGQVIGYIGKSGLATGPHLHYEFRVNGVHRNPLTIKHPSVRPIPKEQMSNFKAATAEVVAQLDLIGQQPQYASLTQ